MVKAKPFVIDYSQKRVLTGYEFVKQNGETFKSVKEFREHTSQGDFKSNTIVYCPDCGTGHRREDWGFPDIVSGYKAKKTGRCPICGERLVVTYFEDFQCPEVVTGKREPKMYLHHVSGRDGAAFSKALKWWPVENGKLAIEVVQELYFNRSMYAKYWLERKIMRYRHIINLATGQIYTMRGIDDKGQPSEYSRQKHRLQNFTFSSPGDVPCMMQNDFIRIVLEALQEYRGLDYSIETKVYDDGCRDDKFISCMHNINIHSLGKLNYFSRMKPSDISDMLDLSYENFSKNNKRMFPKLIALSNAGEVEWLPKYMQKRSIRNRLNKRVVAYFVYRWLHQCGIKDVNIMNNVVDTYIDVTSSVAGDYSPFTTSKTLSAVAVRCANPSAESIEFVRWALKGRSADSVYQFIRSVLEDKNFLFADSVRMYRRLPDSIRPAQSSGNLKDIHDTLVVIDRKWRFGNREIKYSDAEKAFEIDCGDYSFRLAKDTDSLYDIGKAMGICVGSYSNEAVNKSCTILTMQKAEKYVACMELTMSKKKAHLVQLKGKYNHTVNEIDPIVQWVALTGVNAADCYDYQTAIERKSTGFDQRNQDYHVENPRFAGRAAPQFGFDNWDDDDINWNPDEAVAGMEQRREEALLPF